MTCWLCGSAAIEPKAPFCKNGPCQICTAVADLDEEINQAVATLRRLLAKRCDILSEHNHVHGTFINRLPFELKCYIFELLLPLRDEWGEICQAERTTMLSKIPVCRGWRDIAWSNPFLWSTMHIVLGPSNSSRINDWIQRSQTLPLTLHIQIVDRTEKALEWSKKALVPVLDQCSNRLQSLSLDIPFTILSAFQHSDIQYHRLTQLRIKSSLRTRDQANSPLSLLNVSASPEKVELRYVSFHWLRVSWDRLSCVKVRGFHLGEITQLFLHASQMTECHILNLGRPPGPLSISPIVHNRLKTLTLRNTEARSLARAFLDSLTLPCLQEFCTDTTGALTHLSAIVQRSSCPLTVLSIFSDFAHDSQPLFGVTNLVVESLNEYQAAWFEKHVLEYFPDVHHLTLRLQPFLLMLDTGSMFLDRKRPDGLNERRLSKFLVIERDQDVSFDRIWNSHVGEQVKALS